MHNFGSLLRLGDVVTCDDTGKFEIGIIIRVDKTVSIPPLITVYWSGGYFSTGSVDDVSLAF